MVVVSNRTHTITWWCKLLARIALSSCEAELNASLKGVIEGLNAQRLASDFGDNPSLELRTDVSAARGVIMRQGACKIRHMHVKQFWVHETGAAGELVITKIPRCVNWSDAFTYPWASADLPFWNATGWYFIPITSYAQMHAYPKVFCPHLMSPASETRCVLMPARVLVTPMVLV